MPKRNSADHSTGYSERYADETVSDSKQSNFALDHPPDDWRQTDFAHRFTDELKATNDSAAETPDFRKELVPVDPFYSLVIGGSHFLPYRALRQGVANRSRCWTSSQRFRLTKLKPQWDLHLCCDEGSDGILRAGSSNTTF